MFKDYQKYLKVSLKVYIFVLAIVVILKLIGIDYFGINIQNKNLIELGNWLGSNQFGDLILFTEIYFQFYIYLCITCNKRKLYLFALVGSIINYLSQILLMYLGNMEFVYYLISFSLMIFIPMLINKKIFLKEQLKNIILLTLYQEFSLLIRNINSRYEYGNFLIDTVLNLDQLLMLAITYNIHFMKGGLTSCGEEQEAGLFLQKKQNLKNLQQESHTNWQDKSKEDKIAVIIYVILSFIWNILNIALVLLVAKLNDSLIECIFILTSFWISKRSFGRPFHLSSMVQCFFVSNVTYYFLNRITTPIGISIIIPVMLGVGLSYVTSKLVKKVYKPLYRGMPLDLFDETILKVVDKDSYKYNICYDYYIGMKSAVSLSMKYHYTDYGIRQICKRINDKIKRLN